MKPELETATRYYFKCPHCHQSTREYRNLKLSAVDEFNLGPWQCEDCRGLHYGKLQRSSSGLTASTYPCSGD